MTGDGKTLAIGGFTATEAEALVAEFSAPQLASPDGLETQPGVQVVAYKGGAPFGATEMDLLPDLKLIANFGVGYDAIDIDAANARGITVTNTPDVLNDDVADLAVALTLAQFRRLAEADRWVREGTWGGREMPLARKMSGTTVGILGLGRIGREIADRFAAFKCPVHYWSRNPKPVPEKWTYHFDPVSLAGAVDILVVAIVGGPDTRHIVDAEVISALGKNGVLVNVARGSCVDEAALIDALNAGEVAGAALDVFASEPDPDPRLSGFAQVALYPHGGSATVETRAAMAELQRANIHAFFNGTPLLTPVNG
jgi:lactate dehydrogenase-like 2-hydroxyacid dehydrogenase